MSSGVAADDLLKWMDVAARIALRGHGGAEPNPMVGCVILDANGTKVSEGYHHRFGEAHAEVDALQHAGVRARGGTAIVTLEPCNHQGRTGPCSQALLKAGIATVAYGCSDPNQLAAGGAETLRKAGVRVLQVPTLSALQVTEPFLHRLRTGLPWVVAKWAESHDGRITTPPGDSPWISSAASQAMVHRERGRVDAILTGMGTVLADDPMLTVRGARKRREPLRVVWDPRIEIPLASKLVLSAHETPLVVFAPEETLATRSEYVAKLRNLGVEVTAATDLRDLFISLGNRKISTVLVEAGHGLVSQLLADRLVNDVLVFQSPKVIGGGLPNDMAALSAGDRQRLPCLWTRARGGDRVSLYRFPA